MPVPRGSFSDGDALLPRTADFRIPTSSHIPRIYTHDPSESPRFPPTLPSSSLFLIFSLLDFSPVIEYPTLNRRTYDINDITMRRALAIGLALYLALDGVLSSPVQVQAPFELNKNTPEMGDVLASASEFQPFLVCFFSAVVRLFFFW